MTTEENRKLKRHDERCGWLVEGGDKTLGIQANMNRDISASNFDLF